MFEDIFSKIDDPERLVRLSTGDCAGLRSQYPALPADYFAFLQEVGWGDLGNLVIYDAPMEPVEVYTSARSQMLSGIILFGDDTQGFCYGFDLNDGARVVELNPEGEVDRTIEPKFPGFLEFFLA